MLLDPFLALTLLGGFLVLIFFASLLARGRTTHPESESKIALELPEVTASPRAHLPRPADPGLRRYQIKNAVQRFLFVLGALAAIRYLVWRVQYSVNPQALWFFVLFLGAEILGFLETLFFYFTVWRPTHYKPLPPLRARAVDVFITTYDEPLHIIRETVVCALHMRYPHKTYILDDGNRSEMRSLAEELKCGYISRTTRSYAKAGNLNNALFGGTDGEFIVLLDADHVPLPNFIEETIGFFAEEKIAIVQTPPGFLQPRFLPTRNGLEE